ncbi:uncharacterized protein MKK02DRAFT_39333 [Dioszegia hungarica]|uniref:RNI-like protein n=1 Tax=Dioszegia hungarica TaxID=4972 RepID=A0AA38H3W4_9TREE|nr:uncharacterized protein MKK02DRAFT_39333 [Dioszegia hungarica]KAI9633352.1 hypothetical protein MKK02DRAFT_39333 [Dioszegia hungarica]
MHSDLDISGCTALGDKGLIALLKGLSSVSESADSAVRLWAVLTLAFCDLGDEGLQAALAAAEKIQLQYLWMGSNRIELRADLTPSICSINSIHLRCLSLSGNPRLLSASVILLFDTLSAPNLHSLNLAGCEIGTEAGAAIGGYLCSKRSRSLQSLHLGHNTFTLDDIRRIIDAVERGCFTLLQMGHHSNPPLVLHPTALYGEDPVVDARIQV